MKTILFPTDFSMTSIHAILYALELFEDEDMEYILMNAYTDPSVGATMTFVWEDQMHEISMKMLHSLVEKIQEDHGRSEFKAHCVSQYGDLPHALTPIIEEYGVDLIVMGASGASGANVSIFGTNSFATMKKATCPVLTIPLQAHVQKPRRIGLATEEKLDANDKLLIPLKEIAAIGSSWIMGITVKEVSGNRLLSQEEEDLYSRMPDMEYIDLNVKDPLQGIESAIGSLDLDMLTIVLKDRTLLKSIFHKSVSKQIAREIAIPILTLHA